MVSIRKFKAWDLAEPGIRYPDKALLYRGKPKLGQTLTQIVNEITI